MDHRYSIDNYGKPLGNYSAAMIVDAIIDELNGRSGFDHWWHEIDDNAKLEIREVLEQLVQGVRHAEDAERPDYTELRKCSMETAMEATDIGQWMVKSIEKLPDQHKLVLILCYVEKMSLGEIAEIMKLTPAEAYRIYLEAVPNSVPFMSIHYKNISLYI